MTTCTSCRRSIPPDARFCPWCGSVQPVALRYAIDTGSDQLDQDIAALFFPALKDRVADLFGPQDPQPFMERVYSSGFRDMVQRRSAQTAQKLKAGDLPNEAINKALEDLLEDLLDFFLLRHCNDLHEFILPEDILSWQLSKPGKEDMQQMILDYLDLENEALPCHTDMLKMPVEQLRNAAKFFLFAERNERIFLIGDLSVMGSCTEGFGLTESALYWKAPLHKARRLAYPELEQIKTEQDWLLINGYFFNAGPSLNAKMGFLLRKLKRCAVT